MLQLKPKVLAESSAPVLALPVSPARNMINEELVELQQMQSSENIP